MVLIEDRGPLEAHKVHSERLLLHAEEELAKGDRLQASEKAWGAVVHRLKDIADKRGWEYETHADGYDVIGRLVRETGDRQLRTSFRAASALHQNFYRDAESLETLAADLDDVKHFISKLDRLDRNQPEP